MVSGFIEHAQIQQGLHELSCSFCFNAPWIMFGSGPKPMGAEEDEFSDEVFDGWSVLDELNLSEAADDAPSTSDVPKKTRGTCVGDRSSTVPRGCSLKKFTPSTGSAYWHGTLPHGVTDEDGRRSRHRTWDRTGGTELDVLEATHDWLWENHERYYGDAPDSEGEGEGEGADEDDLFGDS